MRIGIPKEMKNNENRVAITPGGVLTLVNAGHQVFVEKDAGVNSHFTNEAYQNVGAVIVEDSASVWSNSELIMKVKEPIAEEYTHFRPGLILFTYLHLAADPTLTKTLKR